MIPILILSMIILYGLSFRQNTACSRMRGFCHLCGIALPIFGSENLHATNAIVTYATERGDDLFERQDAQARQEAMTIFQLLARQILCVVDVKDEKFLRVESVN